MRNRWNIAEILGRNTDTLGLVIGFTFILVMTVFTVIVIIASR